MIFWNRYLLITGLALFLASCSAAQKSKREDTIKTIDLELLESGIASEGGLAFKQYKNGERVAPGMYKASSATSGYKTLTFTINKDTLLDGPYIYKYSEQLDGAPLKESNLVYDKGVNVSEKQFINGQLHYQETLSTDVHKIDNDYLIKLTTAIKKAESPSMLVITVFQNRQPQAKITRLAGVSEIRKDFENDVLEQFDTAWRLVRMQKPGLVEQYESDGTIKYKEERIAGTYFVYMEGKLRYKEVPLAGKNQFLVTEYDANGKMTSEHEQHIELELNVVEPAAYEPEMSEALFQYYKRKAE